MQNELRQHPRRAGASGRLSGAGDSLQENRYHLEHTPRRGGRLGSAETLALGGRCPVCGRPVTVGVAHRIATLSDRRDGEAVTLPTSGEVSSLVPLPEILSEIMASGVGSKKVADLIECWRRSATELALLDERRWEVNRLHPLLNEP